MSLRANRQVPSSGFALVRPSRAKFFLPQTVNRSVTGVRALATAAGKAGTPKNAVTGTRALANTSHTQPTGTEVETVTLTSGLNVYDGVASAHGDIFGLTQQTSPSKLVWWTNPGDLATFSSLSNTNDGKHNNPISLIYHADTDLLYGCSTAWQDVDDTWYVTIDWYDPDDPTTKGVLDDVAIGDYTAGVLGTLTAFPQGAPVLCSVGTELMLLTAPSSENSRLFRINTSTGAVIGNSLQLTGTNRQRGHTMCSDGTKVFFGGTRILSPKTAWVGWAALDLSSHDTLTVSSVANVSDDSTCIGDYVFFNLEQETVQPTGSVLKIKKDLSATTVIPTGYGTGVDGQYYDGQYLWVSANGDTGPGAATSTLVAIEPNTGAIATTISASKSHINEIVPHTASLVALTFNQPAEAMRFSLSTASGSPAGTPKISLLGVRALASAAGKPGTVSTTGGAQNASVTGVRALATAAGRAGTPKVSVTGTRASASAAGKPGTPKLTILGVRALATAAGKAGTPKVTLLGVRATATAAGRAGTPKVSLLGVRALATAAGRAGTPKILVTGVRALASASGKAGSTTAPGNKSIVGVRATATAAGRAGTPKITVSVRAEASAAGRAGTPKVSLLGVRATATAAGKAGTPKVSILGVRALASAAGKPGTPKILVTGARSLATATGKAGATTAPGNRSVTGVRATATAAAKPGTPKVSLLGVRSASSATGKPGTPAVRVTGTRALATATGKAGTFILTQRITGTRAAATAAGRAGTPKISLAGARALASAAGRAGTPKVLVTGSRALATGTAHVGTVHRSESRHIIGVRCLATAHGNAGFNGIPGLPVLTKRSRFSAPNASTILATSNGRTRVTLRSSSTRTHTPLVEEDD